MKILIVRLFPYEINIKNYNVQEIGLAKALIKQGHQCDIVFYTKGDEREEKIKVSDDKYITIFWIKGINFLKNGLYGNKIIELSKDYDVVQSSEYDQIYNLKLNRKIGDKLIIYHGPYYSKFNKGYNLKCKVFDILLSNNKYKKVKFITKSELATEFLKQKGFKDVTTIGVGLDTDKFKNNNFANSEIVQKLDKNDENQKYMLYVGKIEERRNIIFLIDLLEKINKENQNVKLILIGNGENKYLEEVFEHAKKINVYENIIYIKSAKQEELSQIFNICDLFLLPTSYDIFGMVILESMYFGLPIITTLNGGSSTLIENWKSGMICSLDDIEQWKESAQKILSCEELKLKLRKNSSKKINEEYTWDKLVNNFLCNYKKLFSKTNDK